MTLQGKWRIVAMPDYEADYPDMMEPAYIHFHGSGSGDFAFGCVTATFTTATDAEAVEFTWQGNDEMDEAQGHGWAELQPDGSLKGQICCHSGDEVDFIAHRWSSSTAC